MQGSPLWAPLRAKVMFNLSFTSYNPDITSDYRRGFYWHKCNVSLLGYNQIILYSSYSVSYYPAPGPSFFNTDIRQTKTLIKPFSTDTTIVSLSEVDCTGSDISALEDTLLRLQYQTHCKNSKSSPKLNNNIHDNASVINCLKEIQNLPPKAEAMEGMVCCRGPKQQKGREKVGTNTNLYKRLNNHKNQTCQQQGCTTKSFLNLLVFPRSDGQKTGTNESNLHGKVCKLSKNVRSQPTSESVRPPNEAKEAEPEAGRKQFFRNYKATSKRGQLRKSVEISTRHGQVIKKLTNSRHSLYGPLTSRHYKDRLNKTGRDGINPPYERKGSTRQNKKHNHTSQLGGKGHVINSLWKLVVISTRDGRNHKESYLSQQSPLRDGWKIGKLVTSELHLFGHMQSSPSNTQHKQANARRKDISSEGRESSRKDRQDIRTPKKIVNILVINSLCELAMISTCDRQKIYKPSELKRNSNGNISSGPNKVWLILTVRGRNSRLLEHNKSKRQTQFRTRTEKKDNQGPVINSLGKFMVNSRGGESFGTNFEGMPQHDTYTYRHSRPCQALKGNPHCGTKESRPHCKFRGRPSNKSMANIINSLQPIMVISTRDEIITYLSSRLTFVKSYASRSNTRLCYLDFTREEASMQSRYLSELGARCDKNWYLTDSQKRGSAIIDISARSPKNSSNKESERAYLWEGKNRYLTYFLKPGERSIEHYTAAAVKYEARNKERQTYLGERISCNGRRENEEENKQSTFMPKGEGTKTISKMKSKSGMSSFVFSDRESRPRSPQPLPKLLSPIRTPAEAIVTYKIPKRVPPAVRIVPIPREVEPKTKTYRNSSKAKPRIQTPRSKTELVQSRDPRINKRNKRLCNIPLSARNEFGANEDHIRWLDEVALSTKRNKIRELLAAIAEHEAGQKAITDQLEAVRVLLGENEYKKACYDVCGDRMRADSNLEQARLNLHKHKTDFEELSLTRQKLVNRNLKLVKASRKPFSAPIPILPQHLRKPHPIDDTRHPIEAAKRPRGDQQVYNAVIPQPAEEDTCRKAVMKPKASNSSSSSMETDESKQNEQGKTNQVSEKTCNNEKSYLLLAGNHNASDPFYDADATVLGSEESSTTSETDGLEDEQEQADKKGGNADKPGETLSLLMTRLGAPKPIPEEVKKDLDGVSAAVIKAGGLVSNRPQENKERKGQVLEMEDVDMDLGKSIQQVRPPACNFYTHMTYNRDTTTCTHVLQHLFEQTKAANTIDLNRHKTQVHDGHINNLFLSPSTLGELGPLIERPDENSLPKVDFKDLLPPASSTAVPRDFQFDPSLPEYVKEQKIEFLLVQKPLDSTTAWGFPTEDNMHKIWNHVRNKLDSDYILDVCLWCRFEKSTGITSFMLSTVNLPVMTEVRHEIRAYQEIEGLKFETYNKSLFIKRYGISMYLPKEQAGLTPQRILRAIFYKHRDLYTRNVKLLSKHRFEANAPGYQIGQRSRIGDAIVLFDSTELAEKLRP